MSKLADETTSQKLYSHLFEACNILRGPINQDEYKSYVTPLLFFKRISDVYDEETQEALETSDGDEEFASFSETTALSFLKIVIGMMFVKRHKILVRQLLMP